MYHHFDLESRNLKSFSQSKFRNVVMTEKIGKACSLHLKKKWTKISNCYFYHSLPPDQLKYISPINSSICLHPVPSVSEGKDPVLYHSLCSIPFFPLWYLPVFLSFWEWISWHCTGTSGSWVLPLLYTLWNGVFVYLALIPHTSGHPPGSLLLLRTQLFRCRSHVDLSYNHRTLCFLALVNIFKGHTFEM